MPESVLTILKFCFLALLCLFRLRVVRVVVKGSELRAEVGGTTLVGRDDSDKAFKDGGIGLLISEGALSTNEVRIGAA